MEIEVLNALLLTVAALVVGGLAKYAFRLFFKKESKEVQEERTKPRAKSVDELIARYGEPDDVVMLNAARGNEAESVILVYNSRKLFIICGEEVKMSDVVDVTFNNAAISYTPDNYQVIITTADKQKPIYHLLAGYDIEAAKDATIQIKKYVDGLRS